MVTTAVRTEVVPPAGVDDGDKDCDSEAAGDADTLGETDCEAATDAETDKDREGDAVADAATDDVGVTERPDVGETVRETGDGEGNVVDDGVRHQCR